MSSSYEKDFDDEVYEDSFYEEEEELHDSDDDDDEDELDSTKKKDKSGKKSIKDPDLEEIDDDEPIPTKTVSYTYVCDDCDYRWVDTIVVKDDLEDDENLDVVCPMCGSLNVSQI